MKKLSSFFAPVTGKQSPVTDESFAPVAAGKQSPAMDESKKDDDSDCGDVEMITPPSGAGPGADNGSGAGGRSSATTSTPRVAIPSYCVGFAPDVPAPLVRNYPATVHSVRDQNVPWEARIRGGIVSLHAVPSRRRGFSTPGCALTVDQDGETCVQCSDIQYLQPYKGETTRKHNALNYSCACFRILIVAAL